MSETAMTAPRQTPKSTKKKKIIPEYLIRETIDGIPFYYRGFREVIAGNKTFEEIMADSGLQILLKTFIGNILRAALNWKDFHVFVGESGAHLDHRNNLGLDICVYDKKVLTPDKITTRYLEVPPKLVVEVDVNVELPERNENLFEEFVMRKVKSLFQFGTEQVVWIFSKSKTVIIAKPDGHWEVQDWNKTFELLPGIPVNIVQYLKDEGISYD